VTLESAAAMASLGRIMVPTGWESKTFSALQGTILAVEDQDGFMLALGILTDLERSRHTVQLLTPLKSLEQVETLHVGDLAVDPDILRDSRLASRGC